MCVRIYKSYTKDFNQSARCAFDISVITAVVHAAMNTVVHGRRFVLSMDNELGAVSEPWPLSKFYFTPGWYVQIANSHFCSPAFAQSDKIIIVNWSKCSHTNDRYVAFNFNINVNDSKKNLRKMGSSCRFRRRIQWTHFYRNISLIF